VLGTLGLLSYHLTLSGGSLGGALAYALNEWLSGMENPEMGDFKRAAQVFIVCTLSERNFAIYTSARVRKKQVPIGASDRVCSRALGFGAGYGVHVETASIRHPENGHRRRQKK
jgi:hypothetical protein